MLQHTNEEILYILQCDFFSNVMKTMAYIENVELDVVEL